MSRTSPVYNKKVSFEYSPILKVYSMGFGMELVKFVLILFHIFFMICGAAIAALGGRMVYDIRDFSNTLEMLSLNRVSIITLVLGLLIFFVGLLGCCGTLGGKSSKLKTYSVVMFILFLCNVTLGISLWTQYDENRKHLTTFVQALWEHRKSKESLLHTLEKHLFCCGVNGAEDYRHNSESIPSTCVDSYDSFNSVAYYTKGCSHVLGVYWDHLSKVVKCGSLIVSGVMLTASVFASYLAHKMRRSREDRL